jgi:hypothetical protein
MSDLDGNISKPGDGGGRSGKSFLFFLTAFYLGIGLAGEEVLPLGKHCMFVVSCARSTPLENPGET